MGVQILVMMDEQEDDLKDLQPWIDHIAARKARAAQARGLGLNKDAEAPADVLNNVLTEIRAALEPEGYVYTKSMRQLKRKSGPYTFELTFWTDCNNVRGELVALTIEARVEEKEEKGRGTVILAGGELGRLARPRSSYEWNLAKVESRGDSVDTILFEISDKAFTLFALFDDIPALVERLVREEVPGFEPHHVIRFVKKHGTPHQLLLAARNLLYREPGALACYPKVLERYRAGDKSNKVPRYHMDGGMLAQATIDNDWPDLTTLPADH